MMDLLYNIMQVETDVFYIIIGACVIAAALKRELIGSDLLVIAAVPIYIFVSLAGLYFFRHNYLVVVSDHHIEAIIAAGFGITVSFLIMLALMDLFRSITSWNIKRMLKSRKLGERAKQDEPNLG